MIAFALRAWRTFPPRTWLIFAVLAAFLIFGGYCAHRGAEGVRDRQAAKVAKDERKASSGREAAANQDLTDATTITNRNMERDHAAEALPDGLPDDRELRRRCRQLRDNRRVPPPCRGLEGPA